jgi:hypothetical protein
MALEMGLEDSTKEIARMATGNPLAEAIGIEETEMPLFDAAFGAGATDDTAGAAMAYTAMSAAAAALGSTFLKSSKRPSPSRKPKGGSERIDAAYDVLKKNINDYYKRADEAGGAVTAESHAPMVRRVEQMLTEEGFDAELNPATMSSLRIVREAAQNNQTLKGLEINRKKLNNAVSNAVSSRNKEDIRLASMVKQAYDDWYTSLPEEAFLFKPSADAVNLRRQGRELAHQKFKADEITWAIERARLRSSQFSGSGFDNALKTEFRQILMNPNRRRIFNDVEIELLETIMDGSLGQKAASFLGRFAVRGPVSGALTTGPAAMMFGAPGAVAALVIGEAGRRGSQLMRARSADDAAIKVIEGETKK